MIVFYYKNLKIELMDAIEVIPIMENLGSITELIIFTTTLQLLSNFVALIRITDNDNPRNLKN